MLAAGCYSLALNRKAPGVPPLPQEQLPAVHNKLSQRHRCASGTAQWCQRMPGAQRAPNSLSVEILGNPQFYESFKSDFR